ncbi:MAG: carbonic anhydrase [Nitrosomonas sp.]|jgi:carbonic anhydrase|nr:carbonic anhydrase [Nitrosomonas sp.]
MGQLISIILITIGLYSSHLFADAGTPVSKSEKEQVKDIIQHILESNEVFVKNSTSEYFKPFIHSQNPMATMVTCADSRLHTHALDVHPDGDLFLVRNIGNQVSTAEGSVEYGVRHLHTPVLFIIGHSSCGAVEAAMSDHSKIEPSIKRELDTMKVVGTKANDATEVRRSVEANVNHQVSYALTKFADEIKKGSLTVIGGIYDFKNEYNQGSGRLVLININGETNPDVIQKVQPISKMP